MKPKVASAPYAVLLKEIIYPCTTIASYSTLGRNVRNGLGRAKHLLRVDSLLENEVQPKVTSAPYAVLLKEMRDEE